MMNLNEFMLTYTVDDDGVHMVCNNCLKDVAVGTFYSLRKFMESAEKHDCQGPPIAYLSGGALDMTLLYKLPDGEDLGDEFMTPSTKHCLRLLYRRSSFQTPAGLPIFRFIKAVPD